MIKIVKYRKAILVILVFIFIILILGGGVVTDPYAKSPWKDPETGQQMGEWAVNIRYVLDDGSVVQPRGGIAPYALDVFYQDQYITHVSYTILAKASADYVNPEYYVEFDLADLIIDWRILETNPPANSIHDAVTLYCVDYTGTFNPAVPNPYVFETENTSIPIDDTWYAIMHHTVATQCMDEVQMNCLIPYNYAGTRSGWTDDDAMLSPPDRSLYISPGGSSFETNQSLIRYRIMPSPGNWIDVFPSDDIYPDAVYLPDLDISKGVEGFTLGFDDPDPAPQMLLNFIKTTGLPSCRPCSG